MSKGAKKDKAQAKIGSSSGFVSFSSVATSSSSAISSAEEASVGLTPVYTGSNSELVVISKKLLKKDGVTRAKALADLLDLVRAAPPLEAIDEMIPQLMPFFAYIYLRLVSDDDRKVREKLNAVLHELIRIDKRAFGPYMSVIIGHWWVSMSDASPEVASIAQSSFELAIPKVKRPQVVAYLGPHLLKHIQTNLSYTVDTIVDMKDSNSKDNKADLEERFERVVTSTLAALTSLLLFLDESQHEQLLNGAPDGAGYRDVFVENFWKKALSKRDAIRRGAYALLAAAIKYVPAVFDGHSVNRISAFAVNFLSESAPGNLGAMFDLLLVLLSYFKTCAIYYDAKLNAEFLAKLTALLQAFPEAAVQYVVPLFGCFPPSAVSIRPSGGGEGPPAASSCKEIISVMDFLLEQSEKGSFPERVLRPVDCCVCELSLLVLLRQPEASAQSGDADMKRAKAVVSRFMPSFALLVRSSTGADKTLTRLLLSFQRAQRKQINFSAAQWGEIFWDVLASTLHHALSDDIERQVVDACFAGTRLVSTLSDSIFESCQAYLETEPCDGSLGLFQLLRSLVSALADELVGAADAEDVEAVTRCTIKAKCLALLVERNVDILLGAGIDVHDCLGAAVSEWVRGYAGLVARRVPADDALATLLSTQFHQFLVPLRRALRVRALVSKASLYTNRLLEHFVRSDCIGGIILLLDSKLLNKRSAVDSDSSIAYLKKAFVDCVSNGTESDKAQQALQYSTRAVLYLPDVISSDLMALLDESAGRGDKHSTLVYLSMLASRSEWALARFETTNGIEALIRLFFNRLRAVRETPIPSASSESVRQVSDWDSAARLALPVLSADQQSRLCTLIAGELNRAIDSSSEAAPIGMQPNKFARHLAALLSLPHLASQADDRGAVFGGYDSAAILSLVHLGRPSFWAGLPDESGAKLEFVLDAALTADQLWHDNASVAKNGQNSFLGAGLCTSTELFINICAFVEKCRARLSPVGNAEVVREKLALLSAKAFSYAKESSDAEKLSLLQALTSHRLPDLSVAMTIASAISEIFGRDLYCYKVDNDSPVDRRLFLDTPLPLDSLTRGPVVMYVKRNGGRAELVQARVVRSHIEPPLEPFHTLEVGGSEVQTGGDRIVLAAGPLAVPRGATEAAAPSEDLAPVPAHLCAWLESLLPRFDEALSAFGEADIALCVSVVDVALELLSVSACERVDTITDLYRDVAARMLEADPVARVETFTLGVDLFLCLLRGVRNPVLPAELVWLISSLNSISAAVASLRNRGLHLGDCKNEIQARAASSLCLFYGNVLARVRWRACVKDAFAFLSWPLGACLGCESSSSPGATLLQHVILCAHSCFCSRWKSLHSSALLQKSSTQTTDGSASAALERGFGGKDSEREDEVESLSVRLCLQVMLGERREHGLRLRCADTILCFLVAREASLLNHFMRQIVTKALEQSLVDSTVDASTHNQIRLCASRVLHALYSKSRVKVVPAVFEGAGGGEPDNNAEYLANEALFTEVVGVQIATELSIRFKSVTMKSFTSTTGDALKAKQKDWIGCILMWLLCLQKIDANSANGHESRARCGQHLSQSKILESALFLMLQIVPDLLKFKKLSSVYDEIRFLADREQLQSLAAHATFRTVCTFPAMTRGWWSDCCDRNQKLRVSKFIEERVRTSLISREVGYVEVGLLNKRWDVDAFQVKGSIVSGEITGTLQLEDTKVEVKITLPPSYPLKNVEVVSSKIGIADDRVRRWVLQIVQMLSLQDGAVVDALLMWKKNVEKELEGIEACPICYSILHPKSMGLPNLCCSTCSNKFHSACLYTWFKSSGKTKCVICQQVWNN